MKKLKEYAIDHGIKYRAAWNRYKAGKIPGAFKDEFGKTLIQEGSIQLSSSTSFRQIKKI